MSNLEKVTYFGETDFRNRRTKFGIKNKDRSRHVYIIGKTGMGKSTLLENMAAQDILNGEGMCFLDPHGSAIDALIDYIPEHRINDVVYFAPFDTDYPMSFNVLEAVDPDRRHLVVAGLMAAFKKIWPDAFSARMEYILANTLLALLEYPNATLLGVNRMLAEKDFRDDVIKYIKDASVKAFWIDEFNKWDPRYAREAAAAIQNKIGQFTANPLIRNIVGQVKSSMDFREIMDGQKILLVNLSKGMIGEANGNLLGGMLITKLYLAAMSRADVGAGNLQHLPNFFFFVDEFQNFANESFADILSEARKYKLNLTVAHQYVEQMQDEVAAAIFGNVGTMITFRIGATDAEVFEKQFAPTFTAEDIVNLGKFQIYLSLMIDGIGSRPFSARTMAPIPKPGPSVRDKVVHSSRARYAQPRGMVEAAINTWFEPIKKPERRSFPENKKNTNNPPQKHVIQNSNGNKKSQRDTESHIKKALKEFDEKEAEIEMKQIVSPKLNQLLDKMKTNDTKGIPQVIKNIKKYDTGSAPLQKTGKLQNSETKIPDTVSEKVQRVIAKKEESKSTRGAQKETLSSLQAVLQKAIGSHTTEKKDKKKNNDAPKKDLASKDSQLVPKESSSIATKKDATTSKTKEVPEDVLRALFE